MDKVFVVHGRDERLKRAMFDFLRAIGLHPLEWGQAVALTNNPAPYIGDVLDSAFTTAKAVVVLLTGDDEARLRQHFLSETDSDYERRLTPQPRPNVLFEAGMAFGRQPNQTVLVEIGTVRPFSDIAGRHAVRLNNSTQKRQEFAMRLQAAGCTVDLSGTDWHTVGDFTLLPAQPAVPANRKPVTLGSMRLGSVYLMFGNHTSAIDVDTEYTHSPLLVPEDIKDVYSFLANQAERGALATGAQYFNGPNTRLVRFWETTRQERSGYEQKGIKLLLAPVSWEEYTVLNTNLDHKLPTGQTIRQKYALEESVYESDRDFTWCRLSNILSVAIIPITTDGYGLVQARNPRGVATEGNRYTGGIAENIHRYLDEVDPRSPSQRLHPLTIPSVLAKEGVVDETYRPTEGHTLNPYLAASRGLWEEISERLFELVPIAVYKFLNVVFQLNTFAPMLVGVVDLGLPWHDIDALIKESPGKDHAEHLRIEAVPLDPRHHATATLLEKDWVAGGLGAFISAIHYWRERG